MTKIDVSTEWPRLCNEHEAARSAVFDALLPVNQKFRASFDLSNSSERELAELEKRCNDWENVKQRMEDFVKANA